MDGGTFTISNGGVFGSLFGTPIINPPQSAILGMHGIFDRPVAVGGKVCVLLFITVDVTESLFDENVLSLMNLFYKLQLGLFINQGLTFVHVSRLTFKPLITYNTLMSYTANGVAYFLNRFSRFFLIYTLDDVVGELLKVKHHHHVAFLKFSLLKYALRIHTIRCSKP